VGSPQASQYLEIIRKRCHLQGAPDGNGHRGELNCKKRARVLHLLKGGGMGKEPCSRLEKLMIEQGMGAFHGTRSYCSMPQRR
jgi:hypothetical protein